MNSGLKIRLITFDAMNTIIRLKEPIGVVYYRFALDQKLFRFDSNEFQQGENQKKIYDSFLKVYRKFSGDSPCFGFSNSGDSPSNCNKKWWTDLVKGVLIDAFPREKLDREKLCLTAQRLYDHYHTTDAWVLEPSARSTLKRLKTKGISLGVVSNYDTRLRDIFKSFEIFDYFQAFVLSGELGVEKPNSKIFEFMQISMRITTPNEILHVGDDYHKDYLAAKNVNWTAALITSDKNLIELHKIPRQDILNSVGDLVNLV